MGNQASFSERQGLHPRDIVFRDDFPVKVRAPIVQMLQDSVKADFLRTRIP
jgi:hypothetical protein